MEPEIKPLVDDALDGVATAGGGDLVDSLAFSLPFTVIAGMLGMPPTDTKRMRELTGMLMRSVEPTTDPDIMRAVEVADAELFDLVSEAVSLKCDHPGGDLLTQIIAVEEDGDALTHEQLLLLRARPELIENAVEEMLWYDTPVHTTAAGSTWSRTTSAGSESLPVRHPRQPGRRQP